MENTKRYSSVSIAIIAISAAVAIFSNLGSSQTALQSLFISSPGSAGVQDILSGQVWRLITPIFIHFGIMHFVFNMMWVWDLGKLIESKKSVWFYVGFVLVVGAMSNLAQYLFTRSPFFGGMSGVVYGLFGYIWIRGRFDPTFARDLHKTTVNMMLAWFVLCWTGLLGPIANWAHTSGLLIGAAWAFIGTRSLAPLSPAQAAALIKKARLEYLSATDVLQLDARRQWVRDHCQPEAQHKYDTVAAKLNVIDAILHQKSLDTISTQDVKSLDIAFGDALVQETGVRWATLNDANGRTPVLVKDDATLVVFPVTTIAVMINLGRPIDIQQVFGDVVQSIRLPAKT